MIGKELLQTIKADLTQEGLDCFIQEEKDAAQTRLLIYSGEDPQKGAQVISLRAQAAQGDCVSLQLDACFPFTVDDYSMSDVSQFLHLLNFQMEVPGFYLNHIDNTIVYRYVMLSEDNHIPKKILLSLIGMAMLFQDTLGPSLERLAKGKISFVDLMKEISKALSK